MHKKIVIILLSFFINQAYSNELNEVLKISDHYSLVEEKDKYGVWDAKSEDFIIEPNYEFFKNWTVGQLLILKNKKREGVIFSMKNPHNYLEVSGLIKIKIDSKNKGYVIDNEYYDSLLLTKDSVELDENRYYDYEEYFSNKKEIIFKYLNETKEYYEDTFDISIDHVYDQYNFKQKGRDLEKYPEGIEMLFQQSDGILFIHYPNEKYLDGYDEMFKGYLTEGQPRKYEVHVIKSNRKKYITSFKAFSHDFWFNSNTTYYVPYYDFLNNGTVYENASNAIKKLLQLKGYKVDDLMVYNNGQFTFKSKGKWGGGILDISSYQSHLVNPEIIFHISIEPQFEFCISKLSGSFIVFDKDRGIGFHVRHFDEYYNNKRYFAIDTVLFQDRYAFTDSSFNYEFSREIEGFTNNNASHSSDFYAFYDTISEKLHFKSTSHEKYEEKFDSWSEYNLVSFNWLDIDYFMHYMEGRQKDSIYVKDAFQSMDDSTIQAYGLKKSKDPEVLFKNYIDEYNKVLNEAHQNIFLDNNSLFNQKMTDTYTGVFNLKNNKVEHFYNYDIYKAEEDYTLEPRAKVVYNEDIEFDSLTLSDVYFEFSLEYNQRDKNMDIVAENVDSDKVYHTYEEHDLLRKSYDDGQLYSYKNDKVSIIHRYLPRRESDFYDLIYKNVYGKEYRINQDTLNFMQYVDGLEEVTHKIPLPKTDSMKVIHFLSDFRYGWRDNYDFFVFNKNNDLKKYGYLRYDRFLFDTLSVKEHNEVLRKVNYDKNLQFNFYGGYLLIDQSKSTVDNSIPTNGYRKKRFSNDEMNSSEFYKITENGYKFLMDDFFTLDQQENFFIVSKVVDNVIIPKNEGYDGYNTFYLDVKYKIKYELYDQNLKKLEPPTCWMKSDSSKSFVKLKDLVSNDINEKESIKIEYKYLSFKYKENYVLYDTELKKIIYQSETVIDPNHVEGMEGL